MISEDVVLAVAHLADRAGAQEFQLSWDCPHTIDEVPETHNCPDVVWRAEVRYRGARIITKDFASPSAAAIALAERILDGATCRCGQLVSLSASSPGCRWRLVGAEWTPGCNVPPVSVPGRRGDLEAMNRAMRRRKGKIDG